MVRGGFSGRGAWFSVLPVVALSACGGGIAGASSGGGDAQNCSGCGSDSGTTTLDGSVSLAADAADVGTPLLSDSGSDEAMGADGGIDASLPPTSFATSVFVGPDLWTGLVSTIAVDSKERLYVTDGASIFRVDAGTPKLVLKPTDLPTSSLPFIGGSTLRALTVDSGDNLFILRADSVQYAEILEWDGVHPSTLLRSFSLTLHDALTFQSVDGDEFAILSNEGLSTSSASTLATVVGIDRLGGTGFITVNISLAVAHGSLAYLTGLGAPAAGEEVAPALAMPLDGSKVSSVYVSPTPGGIGEISAMSADPAGGVIGLDDGSAIYRFVDAEPTVEFVSKTSLTAILDGLNETFPQVQATAVGPSWSVYMLTTQHILKAVPAW